VEKEETVRGGGANKQQQEEEVNTIKTGGVMGAKRVKIGEEAITTTTAVLCLQAVAT
jgi:hypothetical protein